MSSFPTLSHMNQDSQNNQDYPPSLTQHYHHHHQHPHQHQHQHKHQQLTDDHTPSSSENCSPILQPTTTLFINSDKNLNSSLNTNQSKPSSFRYKIHQTAFGPLSVNDFLRKDWIKYYVILTILLILVAIVAIYHHQIVTALHPYALSMRHLKIHGVEVGWIIPVIILFIISFPPLFGHEIVIILCGLVWGLWFGFLIAVVGTLLGEIANYFTFKYACSHRAQKLEKKDLNYACMCRVIREGGFRIALLARLSTIPGHLVTPVFATTGMSFFIFTTATVISMPKQLAGVYLGTLFSEDGDGLPKSTSSQAVKYSVLTLSFAVTIVAALYIYKQMAKVRKEVEQQILDSDINIINQNFHSLPHIPLPLSSDRLSSIDSRPNSISK